ncbi:alpha/beta fold hydrolase [Paracidovorax avenae]|uniref:alpha/beta fold hydrolase n=1 Tax=Paracidovorax avenae TaxID=80867 RepID=UPI001F2510D1|nr:alpha/beta hydrolase [Paracidovorax avenae]
MARFPHPPRTGMPPCAEGGQPRRPALRFRGTGPETAAFPTTGDDFSAFAEEQALRLPTAEGGQLRYQDRGRGPTVLLGHSYLWNSTMWEPQISVLSRCYRVIAPDLWGHGASGPLPSGTHDLQALAGYMLSMLDALQIDEFAVVGLSAGGLWGAELALLAPERVRSLVLLGSRLGAEPEATHRHYAGLLDAIEAAGRVTPSLARAIVPLFFRVGTDMDAAHPAAFARCLASMPTDRLRDSIIPLGRLLLARRDAPGRLAALDPATTLMMCGDGDTACPPGGMQDLAHSLGCDAVLVPAAGHLSNLDNPEAVNHHLQRWLERTLR